MSTTAPVATDTPDIALVAGGSGGIGSEICRRLAADGFVVVVGYHRSTRRANETASAIRAAGGRAVSASLDLEQPVALASSIDTIVDEHGPLQTVVNATGADIPMEYLGRIQPQEFARVIDNDLNGFFNLVQATLPPLRAGGGGSYVQVSSIGIDRWPSRDGLSVVPKAGIEALLRGIAREEGRYGIRANAVRLGVVEAGIFLRLSKTSFDDRWREAAIGNTALKRFASATDVAEAVAFLSSDRASYITGQAIKLDGGYAI